MEELEREERAREKKEKKDKKYARHYAGDEDADHYGYDNSENDLMGKRRNKKVHNQDRPEANSDITEYQNYYGHHYPNEKQAIFAHNIDHYYDRKHMPF